MKVKNQTNRLVIISGCSGGGKSTLLSELQKMGYSVIYEVGREIVKEQIAINGNILPWKNPITFCELLIEKSILKFQEANNIKNAKENLIFFDRSFLEGISYCKSQGLNNYDHFVKELRFYSTIFMTPPWKEIFERDDERKHSFDEAVNEYNRLMNDYPSYEYYVVELPKVSVENRVDFILCKLNDE